MVKVIEEAVEGYESGEDKDFKVRLLMLPKLQMIFFFSTPLLLQPCYEVFIFLVLFTHILHRYSNAINTIVWIVRGR